MIQQRDLNMLEKLLRHAFGPLRILFLSGPVHHSMECPRRCGVLFPGSYATFGFDFEPSGDALQMPIRFFWIFQRGAVVSVYDKPDCPGGVVHDTW